MNHYETDDGKVVVDVMKFDVAPLFPLPDGSPVDRGSCRWPGCSAGRSISTGTANTFKEEQLDDRAGEFPRFDERFCMSDYRHGWIVAGNIIDPKTGEPRQDGLVHYDLKTGKSTGWSAGKDDRFGEPIFVPRSRGRGRGRRLGAERALSRRGEARSDLAVFEATDIAKGPIALAHLSSRVPAGFHGNWRPGTL